MLGADHDPLAGRRRPGRGERRDEARGRRVLDVPVHAGGQAQQVGEPLERHLLELLERGRRPPEDPDLVERGDEQLREDPGLRRRRREVGEVARALPVGEAGHEHVVEVAENSGERLRLLGGTTGERGRDRAGLDLREHWELADPLEVGRRPLEGIRAVLPEGAHFRSFAISRHGRVLST